MFAAASSGSAFSIELTFLIERLCTHSRILIVPSASTTPNLTSRTPCTPDKCNFEQLVHTTPTSAINISTSIKHNGTCDVKAFLEWRQDPLLDKCQVPECIYDQTAPGVFHTDALI